MPGRRQTKREQPGRGKDEKFLPRSDSIPVVAKRVVGHQRFKPFRRPGNFAVWGGARGRKTGAGRAGGAPAI